MTDVFRIDLPVGAATISCLMHLPGRVPAPVVVCCHGLLSHKNSAKFAAIGECLPDEGFAVVRFDFSGCGESGHRPGPLLDARLTDLRGVLDFVLEQPWADGTIGLIGSSMGGYLALICAGLQAYPIKAAVCWATPFALYEVQASLQSSEPARQKLGGFEGFGSPMSLSDLRPITGLMVVHGQQDETVPWEDAIRIYEKLGEPKRLLLLEHGDHRLTDPICRKVAIDASVDWLRERGLFPSQRDETLPRD